MDRTSVDLIIKNARIFVAGQIQTGGIAINKGKIVQVSKDSNLPAGETTIDGKGHLVIPGAIDCHVHLRDLNYSNKEDFYTGTCAAAVGGVTTVIDMPNTSPPTVSAELLRQKTEIARKKIVINTGFYAGIPNSAEELDSFKKGGAFGFKLYLTNSLSQFDIEDPDQLKDLFFNLKKLGMPILIHAERKKDIEEFLDQRKQTGMSPEDLYLESHSEEVEKRAIKFVLDLNANIGTEIHICHLTTATGLELLKKAKREGQHVSAEVTPHHLFLTLKDLRTHGAFAKMLPPLRTPDDISTLWEGVNTGVVESIATDHAPHTLSEKTCEFSEAANGIPGFETMLPLLFTALHEGKISLSRLVQAIAENPATFLRLSNKGKIKPGYDADLTIVDLQREQRIEAQRFLSKAKFSPFNGRAIKGLPTMTIINGKIIMQEGQIMVPEGSGTIIKRQFQ
jgi:dihydroorotase